VRGVIRTFSFLKKLVVKLRNLNYWLSNKFNEERGRFGDGWTIRAHNETVAHGVVYRDVVGSDTDEYYLFYICFLYFLFGYGHYPVVLDKI
jgi:hypothetical protein